LGWFYPQVGGVGLGRAGGNGLCGCGLVALVGVEVGGGDLEVVEQEAGSFKVHAVGGEAGGDLGEGFLEIGAVLEAFDEEGFVGEDGGNVFAAVLIADVFVVHGELAALDSIVVVVLALVRFGRLSAEVAEARVPPPGVHPDLLMWLELRRGCLRRDTQSRQFSVKCGRPGGCRAFCFVSISLLYQVDHDSISFFFLLG